MEKGMMPIDPLVNKNGITIVHFLGIRNSQVVA